MRYAGIAALLVLSSTISAQTVRVVGPGAFTTIQDAVDAADPGDVVLVHPGTYDPFTVDGKGLVIHAASSTRPAVKGPAILSNLPASESLILRGIDVNTVIATLPSPPVLSVADCAGNVWIEDVRTNAGPGHPGAAVAETGARVTNSASVMFARCELAGDQDPFNFGFITGLSTLDSEVAVYESILTGGRIAQSVTFVNSGSGVPGLLVDGGTVLVAGSQIIGGNGLQGLDLFTCQTCDGGDGGAALGMQGNAPVVRLFDTTLVPGSAGLADDSNVGFCQSPFCTDGVDGEPAAVDSGTLHQSGASLPITTVSSPVRQNETIVEMFIGDPGDFVVLVFSAASSGAGFLPGILGPGFVGNPAFFQEIGVLDGTGQATALITSDFLDPGFEGVPLFLQGVFISPALSIRIASPTVLLLLNPPF